MKRHFELLLLCVFLGLGEFAAAADIRVSAAASLSDALKEISTAYEAKSGDKLLLNLGASNMLARQIEEGAPADIFFSADEVKMDGLIQKGLVKVETRKSRLSNSLVVIAGSDSNLVVSGAQDLSGEKVKRIALGDPKAVPAGIYAKQWLLTVSVWGAVEPKVIPMENVRAALTSVEAGNVDVGIVYKTDANISKKVKVVFTVPSKEAPLISYPAAVLKDAKQPDAAGRFLSYLDSKEAIAVFEKYGFIVLK